MKPSTRDEIKGTFHDLKGKAKEKAGQLVNDSYLQAEGHAETRKVQRGIAKRLRCMTNLHRTWVRNKELLPDRYLKRLTLSNY
jgi:uncharacterized protein YjbJ (UPF0337 family)